MPKAIQYRANSIVFFKGDVSDKIFVLNKGKVSLNYVDIETGQDIHELVKLGEFFGVKSAMGRYSREETALALLDSTIIALTVPEFEQLVSKNTRVIMKMLKVFSNQLRRNHNRVQSLLVSDEQVSPEEGLYKIGEYYLKARQYSQALFTFSRYLVYYPSGKLAADASRNIEAAESHLSQYGQGEGPEPSIAGPAAAEPRKDATRGMSQTAQSYYNAVSLVTEEKYEQALSEFKKILIDGLDEEYVSKSQYDIGRCLFYLNRHADSIRVFTELVQKFPKHPDLKDALFFIARSNQDLGEIKKAEGLYRKLLSMTSESETLHSQVRKASRELAGG